MQTVQDRPGFPCGPKQIIAASAAMQAVFEEIRRSAMSDDAVLVAGEPGTGKELVAEAIHRQSRRRSGPFLVVSMAALSEPLAESELFGHAERSLNGQAPSRPGRFEAAAGGTLFVDEIADLRPACQARLVRMLETSFVAPVGGSESRKTDVRVIAGTSRNLERIVAEGKFREDLYYQLSVLRFSLPPLRQRRDDIPLLVQAFLDEFSRANGRMPMSADGDLLRFLESHDWPGNVRQLRECIAAMVDLARTDTLTLSDLPPALRSGRTTQFRFEVPQGLTLADVVKATVLQTLDRLDGNRTQTAQCLGISVRTLQRKLKQWRCVERPLSEPAPRYETAVH